jgi:hypothetical protein
MIEPVGDRTAIVQDPRIKHLILELQAWPGPSIQSHKSAKQFFHKLEFLADIGLRYTDPGIESIVEKVLSHVDDQGIPCISTINRASESILAWALCDAPALLYALKVFDVDNSRLSAAVDILAGLPHENGYGCVVSKALGNWRGPGKKSEPCPYATLLMLKLLIEFGETYAPAIQNCAECLLGLWASSWERHPYIFYMGTDFRKLKLPFIWYDILHVVHVLSKVPTYIHDPRLVEMYQIIKGRQTEAGSYVPESIYLEWKDWDFGQKRIPSDWLGYWILGIDDRMLSDS